jgi:RNA-binding protein
LKPVVFVGQKGLTATLSAAIDEALEAHELIKVKFVEFKEKDHKAAITARIEADSGAVLVGLIGHTAIFYRHRQEPYRDSRKRRIELPD